MKVTCTQENLHKALQLVGRIVASRPNLPVLANVLLQTENGRLKLSATDLEIGLTTRIGAKVETEGAITVPSKAFTELVGSVADATLTLIAEQSVLKIFGDHTKATLRGIDAEEFPVIPTVASGETITVSAPAMSHGLKQVIVAVAPDDTRPVLSGVLLRWTDQELLCVATDSYRLAEKKIRLDNAPAAASDVIVPARSANELIRLLSSTNLDHLTLAIHDNQILFVLGDTEFVSRTIEGKYPDYARIIPQTAVTTATLEKEAFQAILRTALIFAREANNTARIELKPGDHLTISALAESLGDASTNTEATITGDELRASFNVRYLSDGVSALAADQVTFALSGTLQAALLHSAEEPDYRYVIMPLKTS